MQAMLKHVFENSFRLGFEANDPKSVADTSIFPSKQSKKLKIGNQA